MLKSKKAIERLDTDISYKCPYCSDDDPHFNDSLKGLRGHINVLHDDKSGWHPDEDIIGYDEDGTPVVRIEAAPSENEEAEVEMIEADEADEQESDPGLSASEYSSLRRGLTASPDDESSSVGPDRQSVSAWICPYCLEFEADEHKSIQQHITQEVDDAHKGQSGRGGDRSLLGVSAEGEVVSLIPGTDIIASGNPDVGLDEVEEIPWYVARYDPSVSERYSVSVGEAPEAEATANDTEDSPDEWTTDTLESAVAFFQCPYCAEQIETIRGIRSHINNRTDPIHVGLDGWHPDYPIVGFDDDGQPLGRFLAASQDEESPFVVYEDGSQAIGADLQPGAYLVRDRVELYNACLAAQRIIEEREAPSFNPLVLAAITGVDESVVEQVWDAMQSRDGEDRIETVTHPELITEYEHRILGASAWQAARRLATGSGLGTAIETGFSSDTISQVTSIPPSTAEEIRVLLDRSLIYPESLEGASLMAVAEQIDAGGLSIPGYAGLEEIESALIEGTLDPGTPLLSITSLDTPIDIEGLSRAIENSSLDYRELGVESEEALRHSVETVAEKFDPTIALIALGLKIGLAREKIPQAEAACDELVSAFEVSLNTRLESETSELPVQNEASTGQPDSKDVVRASPGDLRVEHSGDPASESGSASTQSQGPLGEQAPDGDVPIRDVQRVIDILGMYNQDGKDEAALSDNEIVKERGNAKQLVSQRAIEFLQDLIEQHSDEVEE